MSAMASQITSVPIVCSSVGSDGDQRKHQSSASLAFVWGMIWWPVNCPHKGTVTWKMFPFHDVIMQKVPANYWWWHSITKTIPRKYSWIYPGIVAYWHHIVNIGSGNGLMPSGHYLNQCWLIIGEVLWHSLEDNLSNQDISPWYEFENYKFKIAATSPWDQRVKISNIVNLGLQWSHHLALAMLKVSIHQLPCQENFLKRFNHLDNRTWLKGYCTCENNQSSCSLHCFIIPLWNGIWCIDV